MYKRQGTQQSKLVISEHMSSAGPLPDGKWLLVDDLVDSGATLTEVVPLIRARYPKAVSYTHLTLPTSDLV